MEVGNNPWGGLIRPSTEHLMYKQTGVLWVQKTPYYVVDLIKEQGISYVLVYKVHPGTEDNPKPLAQEVTTQQNVFSNNTKLGQLANRVFPTKTLKKWIPKDPVFVAPVVPNQINTFTGKIEEGFFEREEDRVVVQGGERKMIRGQNTGVFIGLSSIVWEDKVKIAPESILKALRQYQKQDLFFDLEGNNNDKSNPLSTYYKGGRIK